MNFYKSLIRPVLFLSDPEKVHYRVFKWLKFLLSLPFAGSVTRRLYTVHDPSLRRTVFGIDFPNPVGLAAGFDKDGKFLHELSALGFGFIEVGTVTPLPQPGNDKPRLVRLVRDEAIINRMGFNNEGVKALAGRLRDRPENLVVGGNIGKNKITPNDQALSDYEMCFRELYNYVDYFAVNVSSPNTPGLRSLQEKGPLTEILSALQEINKDLSIIHSTSGNKSRKPVLLKIAPDLENSQLDEIIDAVIESGIDGIIATNTTLSRENLITPANEIEAAGAGGLSGKPLTDRSTEVIRYISGKAKGRFSIIGVGGIHSPADAIEKLNAGADLVQIYTGFIYEGPGLVKKILREVKG